MWMSVVSFARAAGVSVKGLARRAYYGVRPIMPRGVQIALRRGFSRIQARTEFPRWPVETALHDLCEFVLARVADAAGAPVPYLRQWPQATP